MRKCPFCGSLDLEIQTQMKNKNGIPACIVCCSCGATGPTENLEERDIVCDGVYQIDKVAFITNWNVRHEE